MSMPEDLTWVLKHLRARKGMYDLYRDYYRGYHRLAFTTDKWRSEFGLMVKGVADNLCPRVVDTLVDRLEITGFTGPQETRAADIWKQNRLDLRSGEVHKEAAKQGDAYLLVWPDALGEPIFYLNTADQMVVRYSQEVPGKIVYAGKVWIGEDERGYATMYYPDRIEKYITRTKVRDGGVLPEKGTREFWDQRRVVVGVEAVPDSEEMAEVEEEWPLPNPYGKVPIFHFANDAGLGEYGKSELHDVVPLQDILNKDLADRLITQEYHSYPQRYAIGLAPEMTVNPTTGEETPKEPVTGPNRLWWTENENAKFGQFDSASLEGFISIAENDRMEIGRVSGTPQHHLVPTGTPPSGDALRTMEAPLTQKVDDRKDSWGATWEDAMEFAVALPDGDGDEIELTCVWKDKSSVSPTEKANEMVLWQTLEVPIQRIWRELGFSKEDIAEMLEWKRQNEEAAAASFNAGQRTGFEGGNPAGNGAVADIEADVLVNDITGQ